MQKLSAAGISAESSSYTRTNRVSIRMEQNTKFRSAKTGIKFDSKSRFFPKPTLRLPTIRNSLTSWSSCQPAARINLVKQNSETPRRQGGPEYIHTLFRKSLFSLKWGHLRELNSTSRRAETASVDVLSNSLFCEHPITCSYIPTKLLTASLNKP
jgi:hypothetical protein